jgi:hypothetical protein
MAKLRARKGEANPMYGKEKSPEFIAHMTRDRWGANNPAYGVKKSEDTLASPPPGGAMHRSAALIYLSRRRCFAGAKSYMRSLFFFLIVT